MSYLQRWRQNDAAARALAESSSSDEDNANPRLVEDENDEHATQCSPMQSSEIDTDSADEDIHDLSDFGFSDTVESSDSDHQISDNELLSDHEIDVKTFKEQLAMWATRNSLSKTCVDELLKIIETTLHH